MNKQKIKDEQTHLQNHLKREIQRNNSGEKLKTDLMEQINQKRNENKIKKSMDIAQLAEN